MYKLVSATAGFALLTSLLLGCTIQAPPQNKEASPAAANSNDAKKTPNKTDGSGGGGGGDTDPSTDGEEDPSDPSTPGEEDETPAPSADTSFFSNMHWSTPNGAGITFYDVEFSSDGSYRKQQIILSGGNTLLHCEYGSWKAASEAGKIDLVSTCTGASYQQSWGEDTKGNLVLQGVHYSKDPSGVWNCAATECK